jgi:signal transduction histidine kinase
MHHANLLTLETPCISLRYTDLVDKSAQLNCRTAEKRRIARDLHDAAMQSLFVASVELGIAIDELPQSSMIRMSFCNALKLLERRIEEIRRAVEELRAHGPAANDLVEALRAIPHELGIASRCECSFSVYGRGRQMDPMVRNGIYRIVHEALMNAIRHSGASRIEIELEFGSKWVQLAVRDDGCGMDASKVNAGRDQPFGLKGMHERAGLIGAKLSVRSRMGSGTEVALRVLNRIAFRAETES